jgi:hypothetical protein
MFRPARNQPWKRKASAMFEQVIRAAKLGLKLEQTTDAAEYKRVNSQFANDLKRLGLDDAMLVMVAMKLLEGEPYQIDGARKVTMERVRLLALQLGATVRYVDKDIIEFSLATKRRLK